MLEQETMRSPIAVATPPKIPKVYKALFDQAEQERLLIGDLEIKLYRWPGERTVLCLHGSNGNSAQFGKLISKLTEAGHGVIAVDIPSHDARGRFLPSNNIGRGLIALQHEYGAIYATVAHSMACSWALWALKNGLHAQRVVCLSPSATQKYTFERFLTHQASQGVFMSELEGEVSASFGASWQEEYSTINLCQFLTLDALIYHDRDDQVIEFEQGGERLARCWKGALFRATTGQGHVGVFRSDVILDEIKDFITYIPQ